MKLPKFLLADNSEFPEDLFVVHTEYPRFILNVEEEDVEVAKLYSLLYVEKVLSKVQNFIKKNFYEDNLTLNYLQIS